ncbi:M56 family metallopeptidase [Anaerocolumna sp. AGMB13020]|uniref:M56 family metallopeptidase n=1 Tax=Anaerocolumna sp. AGMB13020 TaxID=3081750 RepID=UPI002953E681|nr:M56 family metallopeptidase [Anaerocolumna sp. AGMB13020]WOO34733.1 M56 family metallopeptidase [Anaerocolumna sp. AGMB13020]
MIKQIFLAILEVSIVTGIVILILKLLSLLINNHYAVKWKRLIWLLVAVRLLIPVNFTPVSAPVQFDLLSSYSTNNRTDNTAKVNTAAVEMAVTKSIGEAEYDTVKQADRPAAYENKTMAKPVPWLNIAASVWGAGVILFILYYLIGYLYYSRQIIRWRRPVNEQRIHNILTNLSGQLFLNKQPEVYVCDKTGSPFLIGFTHPFLVIPAEDFNDRELTFILKHELTHHKQKDNWYKLFLLFVNAIHWFNPVVYLLRHEACVDLELACDEEVIKGMCFEDRINYGETILSCIKRQKIPNLAMTTGFNESAKSLKIRLANILSRRKKRNGLLLVMLLLIMFVIPGALFSIKTDSQTQKDREGLTWYGAVNLITKDTELPDELLESREEWNEFIESDRTIALVASIPKDDIYVYGLKEKGTEEGAYSLHGICVKQGKEIQVLDIDWGVYEELPKISYQDYNGDGSKDLAMISRSVSGTNISLNDLYMLIKSKEGGWTYQSFDSFDWSDKINKRMEYQIKDNILTITIDGKDTGYRIDMKPLEEDWGEKLTSVFFGSYGEFIFDNGKIYLKLLPTAGVGDWATPQIITETYIRMEVTYNGKFDLINGFASTQNEQVK